MVDEIMKSYVNMIWKMLCLKYDDDDDDDEFRIFLGGLGISLS